MDKISNFDKNKELVKEIIKLTLKNKKKKIKKLENERKLSEILNVKRSKIRNALLIVESKGYIKRKPGSGTFINYNLGENNIEDINIKISKNSHSETFFSSIQVRLSIEPVISAYVAENYIEKELKELEFNLNEIKNSKKWIDIKLNTYNYFIALYSLSKNKYYVNTFKDLVEDRKLSNFDGHYIKDSFTSDNNVSKIILLTSYLNIKKTFDPIKNRNPEKAFKESKKYLNKILSYVYI
tara:strand:+ start:140 stop:856 length:717 start_codon:yes stop_codon:yes gene_type:complete